MKTMQIASVCGVILMLSGLSVRAESLDVKLGLWETTFTTDMRGMPIPSEVLKSMPPERRARLEAAMKARQGQAPKSHTVKSCMTQANLDRAFEKNDEDSKDCTNTIVTATRTQAEYKIACTGSTPHHGVMHIEALSRDRMKATVKMHAGDGIVTSEMTSKWIAADCGNVK